MECSALDRSPGGPARRRCGAGALRPPRHASPRRCATSGDSYVRDPSSRTARPTHADMARSSAAKTIVMLDSSRQNTTRAPLTRRAQIRRARYVGEHCCRRWRRGRQREASIAPDDWGQNYSRRTSHSPLAPISRTSTFVAVVPRSTLVQVSNSRVEREYRNHSFHTQ